VKSSIDRAITDIKTSMHSIKSNQLDKSNLSNRLEPIERSKIESNQNNQITKPQSHNKFTNQKVRPRPKVRLKMKFFLFGICTQNAMMMSFLFQKGKRRELTPRHYPPKPQSNQTRTPALTGERKKGEAKKGPIPKRRS
jgi:hypothetical protein